MSNDAWERYCKAVEEMRRHREDSTKWRRRLSARIEEKAKGEGITSGVSEAALKPAHANTKK